MPFFSNKQSSLVGIDVGTSSIKLVELAKVGEGSYRLVTYGFVDNIQRDVRGIGRDDIAAVADTIKIMCQKAGVTTHQAIAALPTYVVFTSLISLPKLSGDELDSAIHWEAKKIIPLPLEDIVLDYKILGQEQAKGGLTLPFMQGKKPPVPSEEPTDIKVLITGAAKETVQVYTDIFQKSSLSLVSLETEMFALARSLASHNPGEVMIVEVGAAVTDIIIIQDGIPFLGRSIETGGNALTRAITTSLTINEKRAEQLKRDIGVTILDDASSGGGGVAQILKETLEPIIHEIRYTLDLYKNHSVTPLSHASGTVEKIILTGGSALLPNFAQYLSKSLDMRVIVGDPWEHVEYPLDLKPLLATLGPKFSVAIGLAMRGG